MRRDEHDRHSRKVARIQCVRERLLPSKSVPVRSLKVRLQVLLFTAVAFQAGLVVIDAPGTDVVALTSGALQGRSFQRTHGYKSDTFQC
jgi:hypothetical protein